ncbi:hypothetical protein FQN60_016443 [Etheostoma spectabile]|uniref:Glutamate decarboxylase 1-like n=1 Tax=Etheostoma spectabile TaxID=54343 RepID=A0A5J5D7P7_9PERO|nr:hypothetical protein FQN60_016443 [Etheostoma spectabile]
MDFLQLPERIIAESVGMDKKQENSAAVRDRGQTLADFSSIYSKDLLPASGGEDVTRGFLQELLNILLSYISKSSQRGSKILDFHHPHQLKEGLEGFSLDLPDQPETLEQILVDCRDTLKYGVSTGGTISNLYSILVARYHFYPEVKTKGMGRLPQLALFTSEHSHYSVKKSAAVLGLGSDNVVMVKCDERGKMIPAELEACIVTAEKKGLVPFFVNVTAGTTVYGAFDPLNAIADICHKHTLWMHVDAAWGGGLLMSDRHRMKLQGIERAWSVTWNPHKMMGVPLQCSVILVKKRGLLQECNELGAEYLFQTDKPYDVSYDTGDKSIQCGRHVDVFKLWLMWKAKGSEGFGSQVNKCLENAEYLYDQLQRRTDFELVFKSKPEHSNVCFWYIPPSLRDLPPGPDRDTRLHQVAPRIKRRMMEKGSVLIGYQPLGTKVNFFRCVFSNPATQQEDVDFLLDEITRLGHNL